MKATVVVSAVVIDSGKLLMVQEGKHQCRGQWGLPGGRVEEGEGVVEAVVREVREETGYEVRVAGITPIMRYVNMLGYHSVWFNFVCELLGGDMVVDGTEILQAAWVDFDELDAKADLELRTAPVLRAAIADARKGDIYPVGIVRDTVPGDLVTLAGVEKSLSNGT